MRSRLLAAPLLALALVSLAACATGAPGAGSGAGSGTTTSASSSASASTDSTPAETAAPSASATEAAAGACEYLPSAGAAREVTAPPADPTLTGDVPAVIATSAGDITLTLTADRTPCTVNSFASLATQGYFDGTTCHRLTTTGIFVLQCGDPSGTGRGGPGYSYADELDDTETYPAGTVAMANSGPDTNGSQFFLVYEESPLPAAYTVFGQMDAASTALVAGIAAEGTAAGGSDGAPATPVEIRTVTVG